MTEWFREWIAKVAKDFVTCFITKDRWKYIVKGLGNTLQIALAAVLLGILIGTIVAIIRSTHDKTHETMRPGPGRTLLNIANWLCKVYLTVIRGTPVAMLTFGINSGAYVAEIIRGGIMAVDEGQNEAGRSLGLNFAQTMLYIIIPQALKNVLPALANEFIVLLKETSVACYVAVNDLTKGGEIIRSQTYIQAMPLLIVAALYLIMVVFFSHLVSKLERRLRSSDH